MKNKFILLFVLTILTSCVKTVIHNDFPTVEYNQSFIVSSIIDGYNEYYIYVSSTKECADTVICIEEIYKWKNDSKLPCSYNVGDVIHLTKEK